MNFNKKLATLLAILLCGGLLSGCGTTLGKNIGSYFSQMSSKLTIWTNSIGADSGTTTASSGENTDESDGKAALANPENWTLSSDGSYSFDAVENASFYIIYLYDKNEADSTGSFKYMSDNIEDDGSSNYSGKLGDWFTYTYGDYEAEVVAYPKIGDVTYKKSSGAVSEFLSTGEVPNPEIAYLWDCFTGTLGIELINIESYDSSLSPAAVTVTFTNEGNSSDTVILGLENASVANDNFKASTTDVAYDTTYDIEAVVVWDKDLVTNSEFSINLGKLTTTSNKNAMLAGYGYLNNEIYTSLDFPYVEDSFNPEEGGSIGTWYFYVSAFQTNKGVDIPSSFVDTLNFQGEKGGMGANYIGGEDVYFTAVPTVASSGSSYTFDVTIQNDRGNLAIFDGFFWNDQSAANAILELYENGTLSLTVVNDADENAGMMGPRGLSESTINGLWVENGDGTLTLSYDHTTERLLD